MLFKGERQYPIATVWMPRVRRWKELGFSYGKDFDTYRGKLRPSISDLPYNRADLELGDGYDTGQETPKVFSPNAPVYTEYWSEGRHLQVRYWLYFRSNDHPRNSLWDIKDHEADWEHVELRLTWLSNSEFAFEYYLSQHEKADNPANRGLKWARKQNAGAIRMNPYIFVAKGGHGLYHKPGEYVPDYRWLFFYDEAKSSKQHLYSRNNLRIRNQGDPNKDSSDPVWNFKGRWGASGKRRLCPHGPRMKDRWRNAPRSEFPFGPR